MRIETVTLNKGGRLVGYIQETYGEFGPGKYRPAVIICPGGGFIELSKREAEPFALKFASFGFQTFVLYYDVLPTHYPVPYEQLAEAVHYVRKNAKEICVNADAIFGLGASAGGYLVAALGVDHYRAEESLGFDHDSCRLNGMILCYPVIRSIKEPFHGPFAEFFGTSDYPEAQEHMDLLSKVTSMTCPAFIWSTFEDGLVPISNSLDLADRLSQYSVPCELHIYQKGNHGQALASNLTQCEGLPENTEVAGWSEQAREFIERILHSRSAR